MRLRQLIPEHFKAECRVLLTLLPENVHHLAVYPDRAVHSAPARAGDGFAHDGLERLGVERAVRHERGERVLAVEQYEVVRTLQLDDVQRSRNQLPDNRGTL